MTAPVDPRTWLAERGLAKAGTRGRFSTAAKEALAAAREAGVRFIEKGQATATVITIDDNGERVEEVRNVDYFQHGPDPIREGTLTFTGPSGTLKVSAREACEGCKHSFGWCYCAVPTFSYWKDGQVYSLNG